MHIIYYRYTCHISIHLGIFSSQAGFPVGLSTHPKSTWPGWNDSGEDIGQGATDGKVWTFTTETMVCDGKIIHLLNFFVYVYLWCIYKMCSFIYIYIYTCFYMCVSVSLQCLAKVLKPQQWCCLGIHDFVTTEQLTRNCHSRDPDFIELFADFRLQKKRHIFF